MHAKISATLFVLYGALLLLGIGLVLSSNSFIEFNLKHKAATVLSVLVCALYFSAAHSIVRNSAWSSKLCTPLAIFTLLSFPVGTVVGGYYLWFRFSGAYRNS